MCWFAVNGYNAEQSIILNARQTKENLIGLGNTETS